MPDLVVLDVLLVSVPVEPEVDPALPGVLDEPELVVSDELPVVPGPAEPVDPVEPLMPLVPPLVEPVPVLPLPIVPLDPVLLGEVEPLVLPGLVVVERVDDEDELVPVSRPVVRSEHAPSANVASAAATATPSARVFICFIITPVSMLESFLPGQARVPARHRRFSG